MVRFKWTLITSLTALVGCGTASFTSQTNNRSGQTAPATSADAQAAPTAGSQSLDCSGIVLHGSHDTCDQGDIDVADGNVPTAGNPAPAASAPASGSTGNSTSGAPATTGGTTTAASTTPAGTASETTTPATTTTPPATDPNIIALHIVAGTGTAGYNTEATAVKIKVGQTLRIFNDDTIVHRLHTAGAPCPHQPANTMPGSSFDCVITQAIDTVASPGAVYDHDSGPTSLFFITATN